MITIERTVDISKPVQTETLRGNEFKLEANAHTFRITVASEGEPVALTGTVSASMLLADGSGLTLGGSLDEGVAVLTLPQAAYGVPGRFMLAIYSVQTGATEAATVKTCIYACVGAVVNTYGDQQYDPGNLIPDAATLAGYIEDCLEATNDANDAAARAETAALTAVTYAEQTGKTDAQKTQARTNIGAASDEEVSSLKSAVREFGEIATRTYTGTETGITIPFEGKTGDVIKISVTGHGANFWTRYGSSTTDIDEIYVGAGQTKYLTLTGDMTYFRLYLKGSATVSILNTSVGVIPSIEDRVTGLETNEYPVIKAMGGYYTGNPANQTLDFVAESGETIVVSCTSHGVNFWTRYGDSTTDLQEFYVHENETREILLTSSMTYFRMYINGGATIVSVHKKDWRIVPKIEYRLDDAETRITNLAARTTSSEKEIAANRKEFDMALTGVLNILQFTHVDEGYCWSRSAGHKYVEPNAWAYDKIPIKQNVTYYYRHLYGCFCLIMSADSSTWEPLSESTYYDQSGSFTAEEDGYFCVAIDPIVGQAGTALFTESEDLYNANSSQSYYLPNHLVVQNNIVRVGSTREYTTLRAGIAAAIQTPYTTVFVDPETFDLVEEFSAEITANASSVLYGCMLCNHVHVIFASGAKVLAKYPMQFSTEKSYVVGDRVKYGGVGYEFTSNHPAGAWTGGDVEVVYASLDDGQNQNNVISHFQPFWASNDGSFTLENLDIEAANTRYCVHDEMGGTPVISREARYINCKMVMDNTQASLNWYPQCIGGGNGKHDYVYIENCWFKSKRAETDVIGVVSYHNTGSYNYAKANIHMNNCYVADKGTFRCSFYGSSTLVSTAYLNNNSFGSIPIARQEESGGSAPENYEIISWMNEIRNS